MTHTQLELTLPVSHDPSLHDHERTSCGASAYKWRLPPRHSIVEPSILAAEHKIQVHHLPQAASFKANTFRLEKNTSEMERVNTSLCLENLLIMQENERLRRKAQQLDQENKALLAELKRKEQQGAAASASASAGASAAATANHPHHHKAKAAGNGKQPK